MGGAFIGAAALTVIPEGLRSIADLRLLIYGAILVLMMRIRPQGILGRKNSTGRSGTRKSLFQLRRRPEP